MFVTLQPLEEATISGRGETVVYISGSEPLLLMASSKRAEIPSGSQITFPAFDQFTVQNKGESPVTAELLVVEGVFRSLAEGSTVRIQSITDPVEVNEVLRIIETVTTELSNPMAISNPIVTALAQTLTADVNNPNAISNPIVTALAQTLETLEKPATSLASSSKIFNAGEAYTIPANTNRRDITVMASEDNTDTVNVAGIPLRAGQYVELTQYTGAVTAQAVAAGDQIFITEVIK